MYGEERLNGMEADMNDFLVLKTQVLLLMEERDTRMVTDTLKNLICHSIQQMGLCNYLRIQLVLNG